MNDSQFSFEFELNTAEIRKINKMYFKGLWQERIRILSSMFLLTIIFLNFFFLDKGSDYVVWMIRNMSFIMLFLLFQHSFANALCTLIFKLIKELLKFDKFISRYKLIFTNSFIHVHSPIGGISHKWSQIEKVILTKDFFLLYIKERKGYNIISISNKCSKKRNMQDLIAFVENKVSHITKVS